MSKNYGDIPCVNLAGEVHITVSGIRCACGREYRYSKPGRDGKCVNIIWRSINAVTCPACKNTYNQNKLNGGAE